MKYKTVANKLCFVKVSFRDGKNSAKQCNANQTFLRYVRSYECRFRGNPETVEGFTHINFI